ncbi:hypothetical protein EJB05_03467, partial [Eragrostis curvula]
PKQPGRKEAENSEKCKLPLFTFQFVAMVLREGSFCHVYKVLHVCGFGEYAVLRLKSVATSRER